MSYSRSTSNIPEQNASYVPGLYYPQLTPPYPFIIYMKTNNLAVPLFHIRRKQRSYSDAYVGKTAQNDRFGPFLQPSTPRFVLCLPGKRSCFAFKALEEGGF
jgi:hypothetical protein